MGCSAKNDKTRNSRFYDLTIAEYTKLQNKNLSIKILFSLLKLVLQISFLVPYNSQVIKS